MAWEEHLVFDRCTTPEFVVTSSHSFLVDIDGTDNQSVADARINRIKRATSLKINIGDQPSVVRVRSVDLDAAHFTVEIDGKDHVLIFKSVLVQSK